MADQVWTWPAGQVLVLYEWLWFDPNLDNVVGGWSQQRDADAADYVQVQAEGLRPVKTMEIHARHRDFAFAKPHAFRALTQLPHELRADEGTPLPWVRALLGIE